MRELPADFLEKSRSVLIDHPGITLLDVRRRAEAEPEGTARRDRLSALDAVSRLFSRALHTVQASRAGLIALFRGHTARECGLEPKTLQNLQSEIRRAVRSYSALAPTLTSRIPPSAAWVALLALTTSPDYASGIRKFACFCTVFGIEPHQVGNPELLMGFHEALEAEGIVKNPRKAVHLVVSYWNMHVKRIPSWPQIRLSSPFPSSAYSLPLEDFPLSFQEDLGLWCRNQLEVDIFDDDAPAKAKRAVTVEHQAGILRRFASLAVKLKILRISQIDALADLLGAEVVHPCLRYHLKAGGKGSRQMENIVNLLLSVARYHSHASQECIKKLAGYAKRLRGDREKGLAKKNLEQLKQFDDPANIKKLLLLPFRIIAKIPAHISPHRKAKYWERALSIGIFVYSGLRTQNVRTIHLDRNVRRSGGKMMLSFAGDEMKNHRSLELELYPAVAELLEDYLAHNRQHLPGSHGRYLFPGVDGGPRPAATVRGDFTRTVLRWTGIGMTPHQARHFSAKVAIDKDPSFLMAVSQRLGHTDPQTTIDYYLPNGSLPASRVMNDLLEEAAKSEVESNKRAKRRKRQSAKR